MLEIREQEAVIVACHAAPAALDTAAESGGPSLRIAPDEAWLIGPRGRRAETLADVTAWLGRVDPDGLAVDQTDGWTIWAVPGERADEVFRRLSVSPVPRTRPALLQGALSGVPGKTLFTAQATFLMVPSPAGHHLRDRLLETCRDLEVRVGDPAPFPEGAGKGLTR